MIQNQEATMHFTTNFQFCFISDQYPRWVWLLPGWSKIFHVFVSGHSFQLSVFVFSSEGTGKQRQWNQTAYAQPLITFKKKSIRLFRILVHWMKFRDQRFQTVPVMETIHFLLQEQIHVKFISALWWPYGGMTQPCKGFGWLLGFL